MDDRASISSLNCDVLREIIGHLLRREISVLMKTCKLLHDLSIRAILDGRLHLSRKHITSFRAFICSGHNRHRFLRDLTLSSERASRYTEQDRRALIDIVKPAFRLQRLEFYSLDYFDIDGNSPGDVLNHLSALRELVITSIASSFDKYKWDALHEINSPALTHLKIRFNPTVNPRDGFAYITQWAETLEYLYFGWPISAAIPNQFPKMSSLYLVLSENVDMSSMYASFPNIKSLLFRYVPFAQDIHLNTHRRNLSLQPSWRTLDELTTNWYTLFTMAPQCLVETLWITMISEDDVVIPSRILQSLSPVRLRLGPLWMKSLEVLDSAFFHNISQRLTYLDIRLDARRYEEALFQKRIAQELPLRLQGLPIKFLMLHLCLPSSGGEQGLTPEIDSLFVELANYLIRVLPSIQYLVIADFYYSPPSYAGWRVTADGDRKDTERMAEEDTVMILERNPWLFWPVLTALGEPAD